MNPLEKHLISYEQALALKKLGFDEPCFGGYDMETLKLWIGYLNDGEQFNREYYYPAPTFSQALRWFRNQDFIIDISSDENRYYGQNNKNCQYSHCISFSEATVFSDLYDSYEEAETSCIDKLIELLKHFQVQDYTVYLKKN